MEKVSDTAVLNTNTETFAKKENFQCKYMSKSVSSTISSKYSPVYSSWTKK